MNKPKSKNDSKNLRGYWYVFIVLGCILILDVKFPLRPLLFFGLIGSVVFYAIISYKCFETARNVYY